MFAAPDKMSEWVCSAIAEIRNSIAQDLKAENKFSFLTRLRLPEEMYYRTLYCLFIAEEKELHHILSGARPNGLAPMYCKVNELVLEGSGSFYALQPGLEAGTSFAPVDTMNTGAHGGFPALMTCLGWIKNPHYLSPDYAEEYFQHLTKYCHYLTYMSQMFKGGKNKQDVLEGVRNLHKPESHWRTKANS